jgi:hypothetical protein
MEDDDVAANTQDLLDAIDLILSNPILVAPLTADDLSTIRGHRNNVSMHLKTYRNMSGFTQRRRGYPVGSATSQKLQLNVAENSAALAAFLPID